MFVRVGSQNSVGTCLVGIADCCAGFDKKPAFLIEPTTVAGEGPPQTFPSLLTPCLPTATAFNKLMSNTLHDTDWQTAVLVALWCTSAHKEAAQEGLRAALAGARKRKQGSALEADIGAGEPTYEQLLNTLDETWSNIQQADNNVSSTNNKVAIAWVLGVVASVSRQAIFLRAMLCSTCCHSVHSKLFPTS